MTTFISKSLERKRQLIDNGEKGFTLIELLVVVLIIGVLAAIAIPIYLTTQETAKENAVKSSVTEAKTALVAYYTTQGEMTTDISELEGFSTVSGAEDVTLVIDSASVAGGTMTFCIEGYYGGDSTNHPFHADQDAAAQSGLCP